MAHGADPNAIAYGADPTNNKDSAPAIQSALTAACRTAQGSSVPGVLIPSGKYKMSRPIVDMCHNAGSLRGAGYIQTLLNPTFAGPAIVDAFDADYPSHLGVILTNSIIPGGHGSSLTWEGKASGWFDLSQVLPPKISAPPAGYFNGQAEWDIRFFFRDDDMSRIRCVWASTGAWNTIMYSTGDVGGGGLGYFCVESDRKVHAMLNVGGTAYKLVSRSPIRQGTVYEGELNLDGRHNINLYVGTGGTVERVAQRTGTVGTVTQRVDENDLFGSALGVWPYGSGAQNFGDIWRGAIQSVQISKKARHTAPVYAEDIANFVSDRDTQFLWNFDQTMFPVPRGTTNGLPIAQVDVPSGGWLAIYDEMVDFSHYRTTDLAIGGSSTVGIFASGASVDVENVAPYSRMFGIETTSNSTYASIIRNIQFGVQTAHVSAVMVLGGISKISDVMAAMGVFPIYSHSGTIDNVYELPNNISECGFALDTSAIPVNTAVVTNLNEDTENGGTFPGICLRGNGAVSIRHSFIQSSNAAPVQLVGNDGTLTLSDDTFNGIPSNTAVVDARYGSAAITFGPGNQYAFPQALTPPAGYVSNNAISYNVIGETTRFAHLQVPTLPQIVGGARGRRCPSTTHCTLQIPSGAHVGDIEILALGLATSSGQSPGTITVPPGWTSPSGCAADNHVNNEYAQVWWHVAAAGDPGNITVATTSTANISGAIFPLIGVNPASPIDFCTATIQNKATTVALAGGTGSDRNDGVLVFLNTNMQPPYSLSFPPSGTYGLTVGAGLAWFYLPKSTRIPAFTINGQNSGFNYGAGLQIALNPAISGAALGNPGMPVVYQGQESVPLGMIVSSGFRFAKLPATVINGASFYCPDCDPPTNPPGVCTSQRARTGAWVHGLHNQWICTP